MSYLDKQRDKYFEKCGLAGEGRNRYWEGRNYRAEWIEVARDKIKEFDLEMSNVNVSPVIAAILDCYKDAPEDLPALVEWFSNCIPDAVEAFKKAPDHYNRVQLRAYIVGRLFYHTQLDIDK